MITGLNFQNFTNSSYIWYDFRDFPENDHSDNGYFREISKILPKNHIGRIRKDTKTHPSFHSCNFPSKMKILKFLGIQPNHAHFSINLIEAQVSFLFISFHFFSFHFIFVRFQWLTGMTQRAMSHFLWLWRSTKWVIQSEIRKLILTWDDFTIKK